ncbi:MAG: 50S ribosomal protein L13 [Candidatus Andersenbacteria bacterium]|nr:50S ribosomal protein L13 [Candidatus Andersenbacteria bacterium]MBI3250324.1 50S ribosomal protein L13 [Candidatus Andersenbacteria bacterium]
MAKKPEKIYINPNAEWHQMDASSKVLGRLATDVAGLLLGKHRTDYAANLVSPVYVIVTNAENLKVTGAKMEDKKYYRYSGYPGGIRSRSLREQMERDPCKVIEDAVMGMLPKNSLRPRRLQHLKIYTGMEHPHEAQIKAVIKKD